MSMGMSFFLKKRFSPFERRLLIFCYEISATALAGKFCVARGTRDTKIEVIECQFPLCISLFCGSIETPKILIFTLFWSYGLKCTLHKLIGQFRMSGS